MAIEATQSVTTPITTAAPAVAAKPATAETAKAAPETAGTVGAAPTKTAPAPELAKKLDVMA